MSTELTAARYGKDLVRVFRVVRDGPFHNVVEYSISALLEGDVAVSFTQADNSVVVATDSIKNITNHLAKVSPHVLDPERFALHLGCFLVSKYSHIHKAFIDIRKLRWTRIPVAGRPHNHSFFRDGDDKRVVSVEVDGTAGKGHLVGKVSSGISDLLVLKSTGSSFENFIRDEYTTLPEVHDRIFSTTVELTYTFMPVTIPTPQDDKKLEFIVPVGSELLGGAWDGEGVAERARNATLEIFATDDSSSVQVGTLLQDRIAYHRRVLGINFLPTAALFSLKYKDATLYKMAQRVLSENSQVESVSYSLPNKHYIPVDMKYIGTENASPENAEVFTPVSAPSGLITATISRAMKVPS